MSMDREGRDGREGREGRDGGRDGMGGMGGMRERDEEQGNSMDGDVREDESGGRPEHPSEFEHLPVPSSLQMDVSESN